LFIFRSSPAPSLPLAVVCAAAAVTESVIVTGPLQRRGQGENSFTARQRLAGDHFGHLEVVEASDVLDDARAIGKISNVSVLMQRLPILCRHVVETQIDGHLDLVTAILARPDMTDFVVAHVCRRRRRDQ
jgi:hypothetical protein